MKSGLFRAAVLVTILGLSLARLGSAADELDPRKALANKLCRFSDLPVRLPKQPRPGMQLQVVIGKPAPLPIERVRAEAPKYEHGTKQELEKAVELLAIAPPAQREARELEARARYQALLPKLTPEERIQLDEKVVQLSGRSFLEEGVPPMKFASEDPAYDTVRDWGRYFTSQRHFDAASTLPAVAKAWHDGTLTDPAMNEGFWADHGEGHKYNIADNGIQLVDGLVKSGVLKLPQLEVEALKVHVALLGMTHDLGMKDPLDPTNRVNHWRPIGELLMGARMNGFETQADLTDAFVQRFSKDTTNPLNLVLAAAAKEAHTRKLYGDKTEAQIRELMLREMFLANFSHGQADGFDPVLGLDKLSSRRDLYLAALKQGMQGKTYSKHIDWQGLYGAQGEDGFMLWAKNDLAGLPKDNPLSRLREMFTLGEGFLNAADANRARGPGKLYAPGNKQMFLGVNDKDQVVAYGVVTDPDTGHKVVMEIGTRPAAGLLVESATIKPGSDGHPATIEFPVVATNFRDGEIADAAGQSGRVIGESYAYMLRGLQQALGKDHAPPKLVVPYPGDPKSPHGVAFTAAVDQNIAKVFLRNGMNLPADVLSRAKEARQTAEAAERAKLANSGLDESAVKAKMKAAGTKAAEKVVVDHIAANRANFWSLQPVPAHVQKGWVPEPFPAEAEIYARGKGAEIPADQLSHYADRLRASGAPAVANKIGIPQNGNPDQVTGVEVTAERLLEGARQVKLRPNEQIVKRGTAPGVIYLLVDGTLKGNPHPGSGVPGFAIHSDPRSLPVVGATATLATSAANGRVIPRNSDVSAGEEGATVLVIPVETARKYWTVEALSLRNPTLIKQQLDAERAKPLDKQNATTIRRLEADYEHAKLQLTVQLGISTAR